MLSLGHISLSSRGTIATSTSRPHKRTRRITASKLHVGSAGLKPRDCRLGRASTGRQLGLCEPCFSYAPRVRGRFQRYLLMMRDRWRLRYVLARRPRSETENETQISGVANQYVTQA